MLGFVFFLFFRGEGGGLNEGKCWKSSHSNVHDGYLVEQRKRESFS